jgi:hypothetical protein
MGMNWMTKMDSGVMLDFLTGNRMDFGQSNTFSCDYLQDLPRQHRLEMMRLILTQIYHSQIKPIATSGCTSYKFTNFKHQGQSGLPYSGYSPTPEDFVEGFKSMFPGCRVEYTDTWEETRPGVREQKRFILIDWSVKIPTRSPFVHL